MPSPVFVLRIVLWFSLVIDCDLVIESLFIKYG